MGSDLNITKELQEYILSHGFNLHPVQKEIIDYNTSLGDIKRMQISISQSQFLHLIIKISNIKKILEIVHLQDEYYLWLWRYQMMAK